VKPFTRGRTAAGLGSAGSDCSGMLMLPLVRIAYRLDAFCGRLNAGLAAVAMALALLTALAWLSRHPEMVMPPIDPIDGPENIMPDPRF
jgi:hypothetical protein